VGSVIGAGLFITKAENISDRLTVYFGNHIESDFGVNSSAVEAFATNSPIS